METMKLIKRNKLAIVAGLLVLLAVAIVFVPLLIPFNHCVCKFYRAGYFNGINLMLLLAGTLILAFWLVRQWAICIEHEDARAEKDKEHKYILEQQKLLKADAEVRRVCEQNRNQINDLFRLIELAKDKTEETAENTVPAEKEIVPKPGVTNKTIMKKEGLDTEKLTVLNNLYQSLITKHQTP